MLVAGTPHRTIKLADDGRSIDVIDQRRLPHELVRVVLRSSAEVARAIREMWVRGAPLIGVTAAYGVALGMREDPSDEGLERVCGMLLATRPTAVNLRWALEELRAAIAPLPARERAAAAYARAAQILEEDVASCRAIAEHGLPLVERARRGGRPVHVLTHCNAGWLATVDWGTALAPVFLAHDRGVPVHVWVSETRPRNQGALTSWELASHGVPHTVIVDNAAGILLARGAVDLVIVGSDRTTARGDVVNKVGTYLKALAANAAGVPFYAAVPGSTIDFSVERGADVEIEERAADEVTRLGGASLYIAGAAVWNPAFDVTPAELVSGIVTERGVAEAAPESLRALFPERR